MSAQIITEVQKTHEERGQVIANMMHSRRASDVGRVLAERAALVASVQWLSNHVPVCVLNRLGEEIQLERTHSLEDCDTGIAIASEQITDEGTLDENDDDGYYDDFSNTMVRTQDLVSEIRKEKEGLKRQNSEEKVEGVKRRGSLVCEPMATLTEGDDGEDSIIEYKEIFLPSRPCRRRSSTAGGVRRRNSMRSFTSFAEMSELSFEGWEGSSTGSVSDIQTSLKGSVEESKESTASDPLGNHGPYASTHKCALLFVDISGFTKLSTTLDPESLSKVINAYFELIVNLVTSHGGDILKFAGDAIYAEWQSSDDDFQHPFLPLTGNARRIMSLSECVASAATCGAKIVHKCSDYPVFANGDSGKQGIGDPISTLNVHCGLGAGIIVGVHVGSSINRREYLILGQPLDQVATAAEHASLGELHASPEALEIMSRGCQLLDEAYTVQGCTKPVLIARKNLAGFMPKDPKQQRRCSVAHLWEGWDPDHLEDYRQLICAYAHPVVVDNELNSPHNLRLLTSTAKQRQVEEAELRSVYVMFVSMPHVDCTVGQNAAKDKALFELLNNVMDLTTRELDIFRGHLRQFIVDDKGLVLIATFGLRGSTSPNMVAERALPATMAIHNALQSELDVFNRIGATFGNAYCGVVGGVKRHEYAVMGPSVNLAARLMCSPTNPGILVSEAVRVKAGKAFAFNALLPVTAKGYTLPVSIFEPLNSLKRGWGKQTSHFVGRTQEVNSILSIAKDTLKSHSPSRLIIVAADSGTGKTTLVVEVMENLTQTMTRNRKRLRLAKHVCRESDVLVPFSMFRSILSDILQEVEGSTDESRESRSSHSNQESLDFEWDNASKISQSALSRQDSCSSSAKHSRLVRILNEFDAPSEFADLFAHHLLGLSSRNGEERTPVKAITISSSIGYLAKLFQKWVRNAQVTVLAIDDVHFMDEVSWQVIQKLVESMRNLLIVCTSRPVNKYSLAINDYFWDELNGRYKAEGRFVYMELNRLSNEDIRAMIAKKLNLDEHEIDESFHRDVFTQSGGMPAFAHEILLSASRRNSIGRQGNNRMGWTVPDRGKGELTHASVGDMIVHRLDNFDQLVRVVLNLGAVLGSSFDLRDIISVTHRFSNQSLEAGFSRKILNALDLLVAEGILLDVCIDDEIVNVILAPEVESDDSDSELDTENERLDGQEENGSLDTFEYKDKRYTFCHDVWRTSILNLMLESRKKQIHSIIAATLESQARTKDMDYGSQMKLWNHWKAAGEAGKAANLALKVGKNFEELGLHDQCIKLYEDTLELMKICDGDTADSIGGFSMQVLQSITRTDLEYLIKVHIALGKELANVHRGADSVVAYQNALQIMQASPSARYIRDRAIIFPIFSGLFLALKFGQIEQDEERRYEQNLVRRFVAETKLHGDPVHYTRALSMQAEMYGNLKNFTLAFEAFEELKRNYDAEKLSADICAAYGSDRSAQCFGLSALWYMQLGDRVAAARTCRYIFESLMPKMDMKNVHNSAIMIYPTIWVMKDLGKCAEVLEIFVKFVVEPFDKYLGEGAFTFALPVYDPVMMLLDLCENKDSDECENLEDFVSWALEEENLRFGTVINNALGGYGRDCNSIASEICLLLALRKEFDDDFDDAEKAETRATLVMNGLVIARESMAFTIEKKMYAAQLQVKPVLDALEELADELDIAV